MATTTYYSQTLPTDGADTGVWGPINNNLHIKWDLELNNTVYKDGSRAFTGAQQFASGTVALPGISFSSDTDCGFYRIGANNLGLSLNGAKVIDYATTAITYTAVPVGPTPAAGASGYASFRLPHGAAPTTNLTNGDMWTTTAGAFIRINAATKTFAFTDSNITGSAASATTATTLATGRTISLTGDVTATTGAFDGSAAVSAAATIANNAVTTAKINNNAVTLAKLATISNSRILGNVSGSAAVPAELTGAQVSGLVDLSSATIGTVDTTGDGYLKFGGYYYMFGTSTSAASDGTVTVNLPLTVTAVLEGSVQATTRNTGSSATLNCIVEFVSASTTQITFYQNTFTSSSTTEGFNWSCWAIA